MLLSIYNFKSIEVMRDLDLSRLTILAGVNSAGKSTVTQLLLILKQTLMSETLSEALNGKGPYITTPPWTQLIHDKKAANKFGFDITMSRAEISNVHKYDGIQGHGRLTALKIALELVLDRDGLYVHRYEVSLIGVDTRTHTLSLSRMQRKHSDATMRYRIQSDMPGFRPNRAIGHYVTFTTLFPLFYERPVSHNATYDTETTIIPLSKEVKETLTDYFRNIHYIGPERRCGDGVMQSYTSTSFEDVGPRGEYTRFLLNQKSEVPVQGDKTLRQAVNRWLCEEWQMARSIESRRLAQNSYQVVLRDNRDVSVDLWQVGFGVGQILPIIVQGMLCPRGGWLIVDSPEIHLHPKVQGGLADFFIEMVLSGKNVMIETHSDHIITRVRRRMAEGEVGAGDLHIYFVEQKADGSGYNTVIIGSSGSIDCAMPPGFIDTLDEDFRAILRARSTR